MKIKSDKSRKEIVTLNSLSSELLRPQFSPSAGCYFCLFSVHISQAGIDSTSCIASLVWSWRTFQFFYERDFSRAQLQQPPILISPARRVENIIRDIKFHQISVADSVLRVRLRLKPVFRSATTMNGGLAQKRTCNSHLNFVFFFWFYFLSTSHQWGDLQDEKLIVHELSCAELTSTWFYSTTAASKRLKHYHRTRLGLIANFMPRLSCCLRNNNNDAKVWKIVNNFLRHVAWALSAHFLELFKSM